MHYNLTGHFNTITLEGKDNLIFFSPSIKFIDISSHAKN